MMPTAKGSPPSRGVNARYAEDANTHWLTLARKVGISAASAPRRISSTTPMCWHPLARKLQQRKPMSDTEKLAEAADSGLLQPRLVVPLTCPFCGSDAEIDHDEMEHRAGLKASVQCLNLTCRAFGPDGDNATGAVEKWNSRHRVQISKRQLLCGWRGMAGGAGCVLPLGHSDGHGFSDGSGSRHND